MKISATEIMILRNVMARADAAGTDLVYETGSETGASSDELGDDPYFDCIAVIAISEDEEELVEIEFEDCTLGQVEAMVMALS